jgi:Domain of unknown function (DUF4328)
MSAGIPNGPSARPRSGSCRWGSFTPVPGIWQARATHGLWTPVDLSIGVIGIVPLPGVPVQGFPVLRRWYDDRVCRDETRGNPLTLRAGSEWYAGPPELGHAEDTAPEPPPLRKDPASLASSTTSLLYLVIMTSAAGVIAVACVGARALHSCAFANAPWAVFTAITCVCFLCWLSCVRENAATYGPGCVSAHRNWTVGGWLCPVVNLWVPYRILADLLQASSRPDPRPGMAGVLAAPPERPAGTVALRLWCVLWHGMWFALLFASFDASGAMSRWLAELGFLVLSIGAAGCAIAVVTAVTRGQERREADPYFRPEGIPRAAPAWFWLAAAGLIVALVIVARVVPLGQLTAFRELFVP